MVKISFDLNEPKDSSNTDEAASKMVKKCRTPKSVTLEMHTLNVDADVLEMTKYVKDYKIILVYVEHESSNVDTSIFVTPKKRVAIAVDNRLRKAPIEIDSSLDVSRNLTPMCHRNLKKEWEKSDDDPFEDFDEILGEYANTGKQITRDEITRKQMVVHVEDLDYDPKHDQVFDDDEHIVEDVHVSMNNFSFTTDPKHDLSIGVVEVQEDDLDVIDCTTIRIDVQQETNLESLTRAFRRVYMCLGAIKQGFKACGREILGLDGCFMAGPWPDQILIAVEVDANNGIYPVAYAIVEAQSKAS
ncbi:hypothetical protein Tco_0367575 [Tanacetum coccineum]